jgi:putative phage-type endonuclease
MKTILSDVKGNWDKFLALHREPHIGSHNIATICGLNPYESALQTWCYFTGRQPFPDLSGNDEVWLGQELEPTLGRLYSRKTGAEVEACNAVFGHDTIDWAIASPDFFIHEATGHKKLLECKKYGYWAKAELDGGGIPEMARCQGMWQMGITGVDQMAFSILTGPSVRSDYYYPSLTFSSDVFGQLVELAQKFMAMVRTDTPPEPLQDDGKLITTLFRPVGDKRISLPDCAGLVEEYLGLKDEKKAAEAEVDKRSARLKTIENQIRVRMGDAASAEIGDKIVKVSLVSQPEKTIAPYEYVRFYVK